MLPKRWRLQKMRELVGAVDAGVSVNGGDRAAGPDEFGVLKISAVTEGVFRPEKNKVIRHDELDRAAVNPIAGRILISRSNTETLVGASAYVTRDYANLFLPDKLWQLHPNPKGGIHMPWLSHWLASDATRLFLSKLATGTSGSMKNINKQQLLSLNVPTPALDEQRRIASILALWDQAISATEKLIVNTEKRRSWLVRNLVSGRVRLKGNAEPWLSYRLGQIFSERVETNRNDLPLLSITGDTGVVPREDVGRKDTSNEDKSKYQRICVGDIGYNTMRMWQGNSALSAYEGIVSPAYTVLVPSKKIDGKFASYLFKYQPVVFLFYRYSQGLVSDTWNLKYCNFSKVKVRIPCLSEQKAIAEIIASADVSLRLLTSELTYLKKERSSLTDELLTGKRLSRVASFGKAGLK
jgi:type I restriction enzyme, S subunit